MLSGCGTKKQDDILPISSVSSQSFDLSYELYSSSNEAQPDIPSDDISSYSSKASASSSSSSKVQSNNTSSLNTTTSSAESVNEGSSSSYSSSELPSSSKPITPSVQNPSKLSEFNMTGLWISCYEMPFKKCKNEGAAKKSFDSMMHAAVEQGYNAVFCHVRPFGDAFYPSKYFPFSKFITGTEGVKPSYDPLKIMVESAKAHGLEFHAWINPYRVSSSSTQPDTLSSGNIAKKWLTDSSGNAVAASGGIYFNPASLEVQKLILDGVREILENYDVDGIHFDDYFYPTTDAEFDSKHYNEYLSNAGEIPLSLDDWRRANVNALVSGVHKLCSDKRVIFGISPAGDISYDKTDKNYNERYADVSLWMQKSGFVDYIIPQIYFGYNHPKPTAQYKYLLDIWSSLPRHKNLKIYIGLAAYKMNENCVDKEEWHNDATLMARQTQDAKVANTNGVVVFSYTASTSSNEHNRLQMSNFFKVLQQ